MTALDCELFYFADENTVIVHQTLTADMNLSFEKQTLGMNLDFVEDFRDSELTIEVCIERKNKLIPAASRYVEFRDACEKLLETADF